MTTTTKVFEGTFTVKDGELDLICKTEGVSFAEVEAGLTKLRDEINRQLAEKANCPYFRTHNTLTGK